LQGIQQWAFSQEHAERLSLGYEQVLQSSQLWQMAQLRQVAGEYRGKSGIYFWVLTYQGKLHRIYVGKAKSLGYRIQNYAGYFQPHSPNDFKLQVFHKFAQDQFPDSELAMYFAPCSVAELTAHERNEIAAFKPLLNKRMAPDAKARHNLQAAFVAYYLSGFAEVLHGS
jgi:hypothetical protein